MCYSFLCSTLLHPPVLRKLCEDIMAKAISPIRLQNELMESAKVVGALMHRSAAEQIEYWQL